MLMRIALAVSCCCYLERQLNRKLKGQSISGLLNGSEPTDGRRSGNLLYGLAVHTFNVLAVEMGLSQPICFQRILFV